MTKKTTIEKIFAKAEKENKKSVKNTLTIKDDGLPGGRTEQKKVGHPMDKTSNNPKVRKQLGDMQEKGGKPYTKKHPLKGNQ